MSRKKKKDPKTIVLNIIKYIIFILSLGISFLLSRRLINLDIIPNKYLIIFIIILCVLNIIIGLLLSSKKIISNIIGFILFALIVVASIFGFKYSGKISKYFDKAFNNIEYETTTYSVVVLKDSKYNTIEDLNQKSIGYVTLDYKNNEFEYSLKDIVLLNYKPYDNSYNMYEDLSNNRIESMIINDIYLEFLEDEDSKVEKKIKVIYTFEIKEEVASTKEVSNELKPINILISGSDSRVTNKIQSKTRSDVNMIATVNPNTHEVLLTSIPRDAYVQLHGTSGNKDKLTHSGIYGLNMTKTTIEDFLGIEIDYVVKVGFGTVINVVDTIGGIDIYADQDVYTHCGDGGAKRTQVYKGWNHFNGAQALSYARERKGYAEGDYHRVQNQQQVLEAIFTKIMTDKSLLSKYEEVLDSLSSLYVTDIPSTLIKRIVKQQLDDMKSWKIEKQQVKGEGKMGVETYSMPGWKLWVMIPYQDSVKKNANNINNLISGKSLSELNLK